MVAVTNSILSTYNVVLNHSSPHWLVDEEAHDATLKLVNNFKLRAEIIGFINLASIDFLVSSFKRNGCIVIGKQQKYKELEQHCVKFCIL